jgi:hypothetical protein
MLLSWLRRQQDNVGNIYRFCNDAHKWNTISKFISFSVIILFLIKEISHYLHIRSYIKIQANILYNIIILLLNIGILIFLKCDKRGRSENSTCFSLITKSGYRGLKWCQIYKNCHRNWTHEDKMEQSEKQKLYCMLL